MQSTTASPVQTAMLPNIILSTSAASVAFPTTSSIPYASTSNDWTEQDPHFSDYLTMGMDSAAASYAVENDYVTASDGHFLEAADEIYILSQIASGLPKGYLAEHNQVNHLSIIQHFLSDSQPDWAQYESSFLSVWASYQSINPDAAESSRLHSYVDAYAASTAVHTSANSGALNDSARVDATVLGFFAALLIAIAGLF